MECHDRTVQFEEYDIKVELETTASSLNRPHFNVTKSWSETYNLWPCDL